MFKPFSSVVNISFGITSISVLEGNGFVELVLTKSEGAVGAVSVNLNTVDGTAGSWGENDYWYKSVKLVLFFSCRNRL